MSYHLTDWAIRCGPSRHSDALVLIALCSFVNKEHGNRCYPSIEGIMQRARVSRRSAQTALRRLVDANWIQVEDQSGPKGCNVYAINYSAEKQSDRPEDGANTGGRNVCAPRAPDAPPVQNLHKRGATRAPNPVIEPNDDERDAREARSSSENVVFISRRSTGLATERPTGESRVLPQSRVILSEPAARKTPERHKQDRPIAAVEVETFRERLLAAMGHDPSGLTPAGRIVGNPNDMQTVKRWREDLDLSPEEILDVIQGVMAKKEPGFKPNGFSYFTREMQRFSGLKHQPKLEAIKPDHEGERANVSSFKTSNANCNHPSRTFGGNASRPGKAAGIWAHAVRLGMFEEDEPIQHEI